MKYIPIIFLLFFMNTYSKNIAAQDFSTHKWEDRLVLILTDDTSNEKNQSQVEEFKNQPDGVRACVLFPPVKII